MKDNIQQLQTSEIVSEVYTIAPSQIEYISRLFGDTVADRMNMRPFSTKFRQIAEAALRHALNNARHAGEN